MILKFDHFSAEELNSLDFNKAVLCVPIGPYEQHGPHLPISTDISIARFLCEGACETARIEKLDCMCIEGPVIAYAPAAVSEGLYNVPALSSKSFGDYLSELLRQFAGAGFKNILLIAHHFDLKFIKTVIGSIAACEKAFPGVNIIEPLSAYYYSNEYNRNLSIFFNSKKNSEKKEDEVFKNYLNFNLNGEIHADLKETSLMMYLLPKAVKADKLHGLEPFLINTKAEFLKMNFTFKAMKAEKGYVGSPAGATMFLGEIIFHQLKMHLISVIKGLANGQRNELSLPIYIKAILTVM
ncbi:MAG: creatininase family protein [Candidatus Wallbacteria bacterium]